MKSTSLCLQGWHSRVGFASAGCLLRPAAHAPCSLKEVVPSDRIGNREIGAALRTRDTHKSRSVSTASQRRQLVHLKTAKHFFLGSVRAATSQHRAKSCMCASWLPRSCFSCSHGFSPAHGKRFGKPCARISPTNQNVQAIASPV